MTSNLHVETESGQLEAFEKKILDDYRKGNIDYQFGILLLVLIGLSGFEARAKLSAPPTTH